MIQYPVGSIIPGGSTADPSEEIALVLDFCWVSARRIDSGWWQRSLSRECESFMEPNAADVPFAVEASGQTQ